MPGRIIIVEDAAVTVPIEIHLMPTAEQPPAPVLWPLAQGIDVSLHQGVINWSLVRDSGINFAYIRATMGATGTDSRFGENWRGARLSGLKIGAYHYLPKEAPGTAQANHFIGVVTEQGGGYGDLPPVVDVEPRKDEVLSPSEKNAYVVTLQAWLDEVQQLASVTPIIYTSSSAWATMTGNPTGDRFYPYKLWLAWYPTLASSLDFPFPASRVPLGWSVQEVAFWQYTSGSQSWYVPVPGVTGACDRDLYLGGL